MPLTIQLHTPSSIPLEVDSVLLGQVREQSADEVARTLIYRGNKQVPLAEFFSVTGSASDDQTIVWQGDCAKVKHIGAKLTSGTIRVEGNAGMHLGAEMTGGEIICTGNTADWVGAEMRGGRITIHGDAGHLVGAVYRGGRRGMRGGEILIHGRAGNEVGHTMRRGLIAIGGSVGDAVGLGMIAGTILVFGEAGIRHGAGMKRGTLGFLAGQPALDVLPTFRATGQSRPLFLKIYLDHLRQAGFPVSDECFDSSYRSYRGDLLELGLGEMLVRQSA
ncbi:MAG: formylmethanofuran dehydrogenase subunit C [Planctomycetaceae bacterium]